MRLPQEVRITVDSMLDENRVRVLISTDGKKERPVIMEKKALAKLLQVEKLERKMEGDVFTIEDRTASIEGLAPRVGVDRLREDDIPATLLRLKKPTSATGAKRTRIRKLQKTLRRRMGGA